MNTNPGPEGEIPSGQGDIPIESDLIEEVNEEAAGFQNEVAAEVYEASTGDWIVRNE